ncbi:MAG TPA: FKBP-type peptidyl-prolyl cis-trans isomerase [Chryseolinea sp.]|nr:FKBP-type peptidyl-prolyl cis-trans isomerase [Chryseolinea sp.]
MIKYSYVLLGIALLFGACAKKERETPNGFKYVVLEEGDGIRPKNQEILVFDYVLKDSKDSVWNDTHTQGIPAAVPIGDSSMLASEKGMIQMFRELSKGDSVKASMDIKKFFSDIGGGAVPPMVDSSLTMAYHIKVIDVLTRDEFSEFQQNLMSSLSGKQKGKDASAISKYLGDNSIKAQQDTSGINYVIHTSKGGKKPTVDNCVEVAYKGTFLENGQVFDQSPKMAFPLGQVIRGWQYAIPLMGIGDSATFYVPSGLAYGPQGSPGAIPPNAIMIFDVTLLAVGDGFDQATGSCK